MYHLDKKEIRDITNYIFLENALAPADVIFIPGCARPEHTEEAARLYREGYATLLIPSGRYAKAAGCFQGVAKGAERYGTDFACEADFLAEVLRQNGVPDEAVLPEREATYTLENAEKTRELLLRERGGLPRRAILCCKAHHARRLEDTLRTVEKAPGLTAYQIAGRMRWSIRCRNWADFPLAQKFFAVGEALAHLDHLEAQGRVFRQEIHGKRVYFAGVGDKI